MRIFHAICANASCKTHSCARYAIGTFHHSFREATSLGLAAMKKSQKASSVSFASKSGVSSNDH
jgi:hypothetical protein